MSGVAWAAGAPAAAGAAGMANLMQFAPLILIFIVFYFLLIRPQQKKAKELQNYLSQLKKGDKVITNSGIFGQIAGIDGGVITLEIADNVRVKISRSAIAGSAASETQKAVPPQAGG